MEITSISFLYLFTHLASRILDFFRHWYIHGFIRAIHLALGFLERLDRIFALRITMKNWFQPLYQDYTVIGYIWGFIFRTIRIFIGLVIYAIFILFAFALFMLWAAIPFYVMYQIVVNIY